MYVWYGLIFNCTAELHVMLCYYFGHTGHLPPLCFTFSVEVIVDVCCVEEGNLKLMTTDCPSWEVTGGAPLNRKPDLLDCSLITISLNLLPLDVLRSGKEVTENFCR